MKTSNRHPGYAPIQKHIDSARIGRVVDIAESLAAMIMAVVREIQSPPPASPWLVEILARMKEARRSYPRQGAM